VHLPRLDRVLASGFILDFLAAPFNILPEPFHRVAARNRAQHSRQYQYRQDSLKHDLSPVSIQCNGRAA
jgi:hypothetical protein